MSTLCKVVRKTFIRDVICYVKDDISSILLANICETGNVEEKFAVMNLRKRK